jgi:hypothetical protein
MPHSEWICNACGEGFETKGRRDSHRERRHHQKTLIRIEKWGTDHSENGKFVCKCGRDYMRASALQCHQKSCKKEIISKEIVNDEGVYQISVNEIADIKARMINDHDVEMEAVKYSVNMPIMIDRLYNVVICDECGIGLPFEMDHESFER